MTQQQINIPRLVIGAPHGRSGKTTVTLALVSGLLGRGVDVQPFKKGPDFIDPGWLSRLTGKPCRNLDSFMMSRADIRQSFARSARHSGIAVVEGAMGLFDGLDLEGSGSTAEIAKIIKAPVILVVDTTRMTRSVAAMVNGYRHFDPDLEVAGVILNKVARSRHENMLRAAVEKYCGLPVLGVLPKGNEFNIPDRHLGLIPAAEDSELASMVDHAGRLAGKYLDLDGLLAIAAQAPSLDDVDGSPGPLLTSLDMGGLRPLRRRAGVGLALDRVFTFYYPENLEALTAAGAELAPFDTLRDTKLPEVDALYIGGGFPEVFAGQLEANESLREHIRQMIESGLPVYAECGGLMYLGRQVAWRDQAHRMVGALPFDVEMLDKPQGHGYVALQVEGDNPFFAGGAEIRCHEFHHSRVINLDPGARFAFRVKRGKGIDGRQDGLVYRNVVAGYSHIHALAAPDWAENLVRRAEVFRHGSG
ncbi:MAG: cobyrinate a,c-diamide synthase [Bacillota bacterium]|jgi:cobyrinic acid a,c-diamide synthase